MRKFFGVLLILIGIFLFFSMILLYSDSFLNPINALITFLLASFCMFWGVRGLRKKNAL